MSLAFHLDCALDDAIDELNRPDGTFGGTATQLVQQLHGWSGHVRSWLDQHDLPVLLIRYEDLRADTLGVFRSALDFLGVDYAPQSAAGAVKVQTIAGSPDAQDAAAAGERLPAAAQRSAPDSQTE